MRPYYVAAPDGLGQVEAWSGYPVQFGGQRRFAWQEEMAADLLEALAGLPASPGAVLAGRYMSTDQALCDAENRLFTNLGAAGFPAGLTGIRFERGGGVPPPAPVTIARVAGTCITTVTGWAGRGSRGHRLGAGQVEAGAPHGCR